MQRENPVLQTTKGKDRGNRCEEKVAGGTMGLLPVSTATRRAPPFMS